MKRILIRILVLFCICPVTAQTWQWANSAGGAGDDYATKICSDLSGNYYLAGYMNGYVSGNGVVYFNTDTLSVNGFNDLFIAKYDANGNEVWVKSFGGANTNIINITAEGISDLYYDSYSNSLYLSGSFYGICTFDSITLSSCGGTEMFLARYDVNGNCIWAKSACGITDDTGGGITCDNSGKIFVIGLLKAGGTIDNNVIPSGLFLAKFDIDGTINWVKKISDVHFTGIPLYTPMSFKFYNNCLFMYGFGYVDTLTVDTMSFTMQNYKGVILTKWDSDGNILWGKRFGGPTRSYGYMDLDNNGNFYLTIRYDTIDGAYATYESDTIFAKGAHGGFLLKTNSSGNKVWLRELNSTQHLNDIKCIVDGSGNAYIASSFKDTLLLDSNTVISANNLDAFAVRYDLTGSLLNTVTFGEGHSYDIVADTSGSFYLTGFFRNTVNLGTSLTSYGYKDLYIAKHDAITGTGHGGFRITNNNLIIYANPNKGTCTITVPDEFYNERNLLLQIYDNAGKLLQQSKIEIQQDKIKVNIEAEAKGVYPVVLTNGEKSYSGKIVFE